MQVALVDALYSAPSAMRIGLFFKSLNLFWAPLTWVSPDPQSARQSVRGRDTPYGAVAM